MIDEPTGRPSESYWKELFPQYTHSACPAASHAIVPSGTIPIELDEIGSGAVRELLKYGYLGVDCSWCWLPVAVVARRGRCAPWSLRAVVVAHRGRCLDLAGERASRTDRTPASAALARQIAKCDALDPNAALAENREKLCFNALLQQAGSCLAVLAFKNRQ